MIAIRSLFAAVMAIMVAGSVAQNSSSSSSSGASDLSSSSGPAFNESSSSGVVILSSSSSGSDGPSYLPEGTYQVFYQVELANAVVTEALNNALRWDFAETLANNTLFQTNRSDVYDYVRVEVFLPSSEMSTMAAVNASTTAWIFGNITNILPAGVNTLELAQTFVNAASTGNVFLTESSQYNVNFYPQQATYALVTYSSSTGGDDGGNGASSAASASLLIGSMIAALALAL